jgi:hypothetical protein
LCDSFLSFAKDVRFAKNIFERRDGIYARRSLATQLAARKRLLNLKLNSDQSIIQHFTAFENIITELTTTGVHLDEMHKTLRLLLTLARSNNDVITALEALSEENINLAFVKNSLLHHEVKLR